MTDHLEPYRRMVRSMRFSPPISLTQPSQQSVALPVRLAAGVDSSRRKTISEVGARPDLGPPVDPSEHVAALVHEAVWKPTILPITYSIPENLGDRISRLTAPKAVKSYTFQPKIPQPDTNGRSAYTIEPQPTGMNGKGLGETVYLEATAPSSVAVQPAVAEKIPSEEKVPRTEESAAAEQKPDDQQTAAIAQSVAVDEIANDEQVTVVAEPVVVEEIPDDQAAVVVEQPATVEETSSEEPVAAIAEPAVVEDTPDSEATASIAEPAEVEQNPDDQAAAAVADEPVAVEETPSDELLAVVAEPPAPAIEETPDDISENNTLVEGVGEPVAIAQETSDTLSETDTSVAEAENTQASVLLEKEPSEAEADSTPKTPDPDQNGSEAEVEPTVTEVSATESIESLSPEVLADEEQTAPAPSLSERVAAVVEAAAPALTNPDTDKKNTEAAEPIQTADEQASDTKTVKIACPECHSPDIRKNGRRHGKQRYICKDCGRQFVMSDPAEGEDNSETTQSSNKGSQTGKTVSPSTSKSSNRGSKKKTKPKGFGGSKA